MESDSRVAQRGKQVGARIDLGWICAATAPSGSEEHAIRYALRTCRDRAEPYARIDIGIVRLIDAEGLAIALHGGNGLPVPMTARASVQSSICAGVASLRSVGFESGKMIGRAVRLAISRTIFSVKAFGWPDVPIKLLCRAL